MSCCIVGIVRPNPNRPGAEARASSAKRQCQKDIAPISSAPNVAGLPRALRRLKTEDLGGQCPQDHDPDVIPVSPAAFNPRPKGNQMGLPPAAKVAALYQADSR